MCGVSRRTRPAVSHPIDTSGYFVLTVLNTIRLTHLGRGRFAVEGLARLRGGEADLEAVGGAHSAVGHQKFVDRHGEDERGTSSAEARGIVKPCGTKRMTLCIQRVRIMCPK